MTNVVSLSHQQFTVPQIEIIRKSVAPKTNDDELNLFLETAKLYGLNPFTKQISARIYSENDASKRSMAIIVQIDGFRSIAARGGDYRPDDDEPTFTYNADLKGPANPLGIEKVVVKVFKMDTRGNWNKISAAAYWDEFAPMTDEWDYCPVAKKRKPTGKKTLSDTWEKMPRLMIAKCAEAQALRKGWPEALSGLYSPEETDRADFDGTATEALEQAQAEKRMKLIGGNKSDLPLQLDPGGEVQMIGGGLFFDHVDQYLNRCDRPDQVQSLLDRNRAAFKRFWAEHPTDALELKKLTEDRTKALQAEGVV